MKGTTGSTVSSGVELYSSSSWGESGSWIFSSVSSESPVVLRHLIVKVEKLVQCLRLVNKDPALGKNSQNNRLVRRFVEDENTGD